MLKEEIYAQGKAGKEASKSLRSSSILVRNKALREMSEALLRKQETILLANKQDMEEGRKNGLSRTMLDRLMLTEARIKSMADGLVSLIALNDPIGNVEEAWKRPNGLEIGVMRVSIGLIAMIYEARPNVTVEAAGLAIKTGNAIILRGSKDAYFSNRVIAEILSSAAIHGGLPKNVIQLVESQDRESVNILLKMNKYLDVVIPRGGAGLIKNVVENATVPVIETGTGNCHAYIDEGADLEMALNIVLNGKVQRPSVCNSLETVLVHESLKEDFLPILALSLQDKNVLVKSCQESLEYFQGGKLADEEDYQTEFLDYIIAVKLVSSIDEALAHIEKYSTKHSEVIVTKSYDRARYFQREVDSACVYVNASTRFSDGEEFGFGAEIGISTQKLHARGPMGLKALTTIKYIISGDGQIRK